MEQKSDLIREGIDETRIQLTEKLSDLEGQLWDTVQSAKESVQSAVRKLSPRYQIEQHPLATIGGAIAAGYLAGKTWKARSRTGEAAAPTPRPELRPAPPTPVAKPPAGPSRGSRFRNYFDDEIQLVKTMALTGLASALASAAKEALPHLASHIDRIADSTDRKFRQFKRKSDF